MKYGRNEKVHFQPFLKEKEKLIKRREKAQAYIVTVSIYASSPQIT